MANAQRDSLDHRIKNTTLKILGVLLFLLAAAGVFLFAVKGFLSFAKTLFPGLF